jgi:hypothetical protein
MLTSTPANGRRPIARALVGMAAALALRTAPLGAQRAAAPEDFLAVTRCESGHAVTVTRPDVARSSQAEEIAAHEAVHRLQAGVHPTCEAFIATITSARRTIEVELPAYCAQWRVAVARGADSVATRREFAWRMAAQSGAMENRLEILQWFERDCP